MLLENWQKNALGREVPGRLGGREYRPFAGSFATMPEPTTHPARVPVRPFDGSSKVTTFQAAFDVVRDGDAVSFPHYYRNGGDRFLRAVIAELKRRGLKGIRLIGNAYFGDLEYLLEAMRERHGRVRLRQPVRRPRQGRGQRCAPALTDRRLQPRRPAARTSCWESSRCAWRSSPPPPRTSGATPPASSASATSCAARSACSTPTCATPTTPACAPARSSTASCRTARSRWSTSTSWCRSRTSANAPGSAPAPSTSRGSCAGGNLKVADRVMALLGAAGLLRDGVAFQSGSGASLAILQRLSDHFAEHGLVASFTIGGITQIHVEMLRRGAVELILHGQCFQPTDLVFDSLRNDPGPPGGLDLDLRQPRLQGHAHAAARLLAALVRRDRRRLQRQHRHRLRRPLRRRYRRRSRTSGARS